ncbi:MAG: hypothetical protein U9N72_05355 [Bacteroidota bacterium]|nr:hypothetical protein [Bacteroidota bacterium]
MHRSIFLLLVATSLLLKSCLPSCDEYIEGSLPLTAVNLENFNTEYDDYNATAPDLGVFIPFCFSSNRDSEGENFDIVYKPMTTDWDENTGTMSVLNDYGTWLGYQEQFKVIQYALDVINSDSNELGPYFMMNTALFYNDYDFLFMYASDIEGDFDIGFTYSYDTPDFKETRAIKFLNSPYDDLYPAFNMYYTRIYFCSDRDNDVFNIYWTSVQRGVEELVAEFSDSTRREITLEPTLSSNYNDKCPFIYGKLMVFASDRPGGEGGFDLYYSIYSNDQWSEPVNFGPNVNSPYDEYRPIVVNESIDYYKDMLIFSSDRPGGKGGFDLYYAGIY